MGYVLPDSRSLKPKHVRALISRWKERRLTDATIKNRMAWVRWWASKTRKTGLLPSDNAALGLADVATFKGRKASATMAGAMDALPERMRLAIRLQMAFGLRLEECLKFRVATADRGAAVALTASWCKGGRPRIVPVVHTRQRDLLDEVHRVCGDGSLVPAGMSYIQYRKAVEKATLEAGVRNMHKHRHWYACWRYRTLAGIEPPALGGPVHDDLPVAQRLAIDAIRLQISRELGHGRIDVTDAYLGRRQQAGRPRP